MNLLSICMHPDTILGDYQRGALVAYGIGSCVVGVSGGQRDRVWQKQDMKQAPRIFFY